MAVGDSFRGIFRSRYLKELAKPENRRTHLVTALETAKRLAMEGRDPDDSRAPLLLLADDFVEAGEDPIEVFGLAHRSLANDPFWLERCAAELAAREKVTDEALQLLEGTVQNPTVLVPVWRRLQVECQASGNASLQAALHRRVLEHCAAWFPDPTLSKWLDRHTRDEAFRMFRAALDAVTSEIIATQRTDAKAQDILRLKLLYDPEDAEALQFAATQIRLAGADDEKSLGLALRALVANPADVELKKWVARTLLKTPGYEEEGIELLRQCAALDPGDAATEALLVSRLKELPELSEADLPFLLAHVQRNPSDQRALELVADQLARRNDTSEEALAIYKSAAAQSPSRARFLRMIGRAETTRGNWSTVIEIFNDLRANGEETEEVILPLAVAYAEFGRSDMDAIKVYRRALELGTLKPEIHDLYCRHLYMREKSLPASVAQFKATLEVMPRCQWARLGSINHLVESGDTARALERAAELLRESPRDLEAQKLAAHALAESFGRRQIALVTALPKEAATPILERAHILQPDAVPIMEALVRRRLENGQCDAETARMLAELCRQMPEALDLRAARADVLWALGQRENALALYRDVLARHAALPPAKAGIIPPDRLEAMSSRLVEAVLLGEEPKPSEVEALVEACSRPDASPEWVIGAATLFMCYDIQHPMRGALLERAASLAAPEDDRFELAVAETKAQKGNPRPAIRLALKRLDRGDLDDQTVMLIRSAGAVARPGQLAAEEQARLAEHLRSMKSRNECGEALVDLLARCADPSERLAALWEAIQPIYGEHPGILKALAACYEVQGRDARAADLLRRAAECAEMDDASTIRMARINARLQRTQPEHLPLAERAHALEPADQDIALYLASLYLEAGRLPEAQEILLELVEKADERVAERILWMLGSNLRVATTQPLLLLLLVRVCLRLGRLDEALMNLGRLQPSYSRHFAPIMECYSELIAKDPSNLQARMERAILWRLSGNAAEAIEDLTHARKLAPDNTDILGELAEATRQKLEAERSTDANEWAKLGDLLFEAGDADGALDACVRAVELDANSERCLVLLARVQLETGALALCHQTLRRLPASPRRVQLLQRLAAAFEDTGDFAGAAAVLSEALDDSGTQRETIRRLRDLHLKRAEVSQRSTSNREILSTLSTKAQGRYDIREEIGRGSMGVVYKAYDKELDEVVVLKILPADFARNPEMVARFRNEAKAARKLAHPNIVRIHDIGEEDGRKHLSMEYVSGGDLKQRLRERGGPFPIAEAVRIAREIARGLAHAHSEGVLHRDIKPANILMTPSGRVKISDFGIAALVQEAEGRLRYDTADTVAGTPLYMSPEQFAGHDLSPATDYYSLGVILYELLAGHPPFTRGSISYHHQFTPPAPIPGIPMSSWKVLERLLRKEPRERYLSAVDLLQDLDRIDPFGRGRSQEAVPMLTLDDLTDPTDLGLGHMPTPRPAASPGVDLNGERTPLNIRAATDVEGVGLEIVDPGHDSTKVIKTRPMQS